LEVRRGIGTFISETPGFSLDAMGLAFLDLQAQANEIKRMTRQMDIEELNAFPHLSFEMQNHVRQRLMASKRTSLDLCKAIFENLETTALFRQCTLKHRMMRVVHDAYLKVLMANHAGQDVALGETYDKLCAALGEKNAGVYYDDFFLRLIKITEE
jgi:hypothetical protein